MEWDGTIQNAPPCGFTVVMENGIPCYSLPPIKVNVVPKELDIDKYDINNPPEWLMSESMKLKLQNPSPYFLKLMELVE